MLNAVALPAAWAAERRKSRRFFEVMLASIVKKETERNGFHAGAGAVLGGTQSTV
jgi:hypothetical protein